MQLSVHRDGENYVLMASFLHDDGQREIYSALVPRECNPETFYDLLVEMAGQVMTGDSKI